MVVAWGDGCGRPDQTWLVPEGGWRVPKGGHGGLLVRKALVMRGERAKSPDLRPAEEARRGVAGTRFLAAVASGGVAVARFLTAVARRGVAVVRFLTAVTRRGMAVARFLMAVARRGVAEARFLAADALRGVVEARFPAAVTRFLAGKAVSAVDGVRKAVMAAVCASSAR